MAVAGACAAALLCGPSVPVSADTAAGTAHLTPADATDLAADLAGALKDDMAGAYYDAGERKLVVNVLTPQAAERARQAGAEPRTVRYSSARLDAVRDGLTAGAVPGTARAVDPRLNRVVVTADDTVRGDDLRTLRERVGAQGGAAVLRQVPDRFSPYLMGGDEIRRGDGVGCSLGYNVTRNGLPYFLTAGHCARVMDRWYPARSGRMAGITVASTFPGDDHALVRYVARVDRPSRVNLYNGSSQAINRAADPIVGQPVRRSGFATGVREGRVTALDVSVTYRQGTVHGLIQTTACAEPGDSGGPLFWGDTGHGMTSGGRGDCTRGGETFHQPLTEALRDNGARLG
ncbi:serine protease [Streptomyces carminius]|uniref:Serine protease n=1 Tax=Streptomyces carminius TaxID=2665496 RepID=A0A2M8LSD1_9ACTN|nr:S1 family peptidase [Streptomyces carminius]PJE94870.1 serine protease [Streptomyces carminius]